VNVTRRARCKPNSNLGHSLIFTHLLTITQRRVLVWELCDNKQLRRSLGAAQGPIPGRGFASVGKLNTSTHKFLFSDEYYGDFDQLIPGAQFLAGKAVASPGDSFEAMRGNLAAASLAGAEGTAGATAQRVVNFLQ
jgi:hypothetical protein